MLDTLVGIMDLSKNSFMETYEFVSNIEDKKKKLFQ